MVSLGLSKKKQIELGSASGRQHRKMHTLLFSSLDAATTLNFPSIH